MLDYHGVRLYPNCEEIMSGRSSGKILILNAKEITLKGKMTKPKVREGFVYSAAGIFDSKLVGIRNPIISFVAPTSIGFKGCKIVDGL